MLPFTLLAVLAAAPVEHYLFGLGQDWAVVDSTGAIARRLSLKQDGIPDDVRDAAVSRDGKMVAVAAFSPSQKNVMLYLWDTETGAVVQVGEAQGFHAAPSFSADGKWLTFAHHATLGGPMGMHQPREYAQLYRQFLPEGDPEALTSNDGCHMESFSRNGAAIYMTHADCKGGRRIEVFSADGGVSHLSEFGDRYGEPSVSSDGKWVVVSRIDGDWLEVAELSALVPLKIEMLWRGERQRSRFRPQYLGTSRDVVFQNGADIVRISRIRNGNKSEVVGRVR